MEGGWTTELLRACRMGDIKELGLHLMAYVSMWVYFSWKGPLSMEWKGFGQLSFCGLAGWVFTWCWLAGGGSCWCWCPDISPNADTALEAAADRADQVFIGARCVSAQSPVYPKKGVKSTQPWLILDLLAEKLGWLTLANHLPTCWHRGLLRWCWRWGWRWCWWC